MTSNPMLNIRAQDYTMLDTKPMTIQGAINKSLILVAIVLLTGGYTWNLCTNGFGDKVYLLTMVSSVAALILAIITSFKPDVSKITAPIYALCEGFLVGAVSYLYNSLYQGIVVQAAGATILALFTMLLLYKAKIIRCTPVFQRVIFISTLAIAIFYLIGWIASMFGHPMTIFNGSVTGIVLSVVICAIAAFNYIIDFHVVEQSAAANYPSYYEWYCGFALLVTTVWLYFELLRLLAQLSKRN